MEIQELTFQMGNPGPALYTSQYIPAELSPWCSQQQLNDMLLYWFFPLPCLESPVPHSCFLDQLPNEWYQALLFREPRITQLPCTWTQFYEEMVSCTLRGQSSG